MRSTPKFTSGNRVIAIHDHAYFQKGDTGVVDDGNVDTYAGERYIRVSMDTKSGNTRINAKESMFDFSSPYGITSFTISREDLTMWRKVLRGEQNLEDPDAEEVAARLDELLDPAITRTYTVQLTGKAQDIDAVMFGITSSSNVLDNTVDSTIEMTSEKSA